MAYVYAKLSSMWITYLEGISLCFGYFLHAFFKRASISHPACFIHYKVFQWTQEMPPDSRRPLDTYYDENMGRLMTYMWYDYMSFYVLY